MIIEGSIENLEQLLTKQLDFFLITYEEWVRLKMHCEIL
jgi:hypothetical protein